MKKNLNEIIEKLNNNLFIILIEIFEQINNENNNNLNNINNELNSTLSGIYNNYVE